MGLMHMIHVANATYQAMCPNGCAVNCWGRNACIRVADRPGSWFGHSR